MSRNSHPVARLWTVFARDVRGARRRALTLVLVLLPLILWAAPAQRVLHSFTGGSDGAQPFAGLILDGNGNLYGTTAGGGGAVEGGVVFQLSPGGTETSLYSFCSDPPFCSDGTGPLAGLILDSNGNLYGTTRNGGAFGQGVVFMLPPGGIERVLYSFCSDPPICSDGAQPQAGLIVDASGNFYGTTSQGGAADKGVVFKLSAAGIETVLYSFCSDPPVCSDGNGPVAGLITDSNGNLYGTTFGGGTSNAGVVFQLSPLGTETVLYSFTGGGDGAFPFAGLIADSNGNLYGTTSQGGATGTGVVFQLSPGGTETVLHSFTGGSDGILPFAGVIADSNGNLFGTTRFGGASGNGVVFGLSPSGIETVLYAFTGGGDGAFPSAGLIADSSGNLYGTTFSGGGAGCFGSGCGTVFELTGTGFVP